MVAAHLAVAVTGAGATGAAATGVAAKGGLLGAAVLRAAAVMVPLGAGVMVAPRVAIPVGRRVAQRAVAEKAPAGPVVGSCTWWFLSRHLSWRCRSHPRNQTRHLRRNRSASP